MSEETKKPEEEAIETGGTFAEQIAGLTKDQLQVVKQTVDAESGKREEPNYSGMSDQAFREEVRKRHGYSPL